VDYPVWNVAMGGSVLMAVVAIAHVIVSHFAVGGGLVIAVTETLSVRRGDRAMRELARRGSLMLILVSTVFGAISGVGIWVVAGLISPGAIAALIHNYVWGWAIEWTFFVVEIVAALVYYVTWGRISKGAHLMIGWVYFVAAYLSLVIINGIITFMLTPGSWLATHRFWDGFFNPTYWPSLVLRTGICALMATAFLLFMAQRAKAEARPGLVRYLGWWLVGGALVSYAGYRWWEASLPDTVLGLFRGDSPAVAALASTRSLALWALAVALLLGIVFLVMVPRAGRWAVAVVVAVTAFTFFGSYERLREGSRKPFLIHSYLFSNGLRVADIPRLNEQGLATASGWVAARAGDGPLAYGRAVFEVQCASCHTLNGYQALRPRLPDAADILAVAADEPPGNGERVFRTRCASCHRDYTYDDMKGVIPSVREIRDDPAFVRDMLETMTAGILQRLHEMGGVYTAADPTRAIDTRKTPYPFMPPLVGTDADRQALAAYLRSLEAPEPLDATLPGRSAAEGGE